MYFYYTTLNRQTIKKKYIYITTMNTSAVSLINLGSMAIFASCVIHAARRERLLQVSQVLGARIWGNCLLKLSQA